MTGSFSRLFQSRGRTPEVRGIIDISYHIRIISLPHTRYSTCPGRSATPNPADALGFPDAGRTARSVSVIA